jgi:hypothetical protein
MTKVGVAHSKKRAAHDAGVEVCALALQQLEGKRADLVLVFGDQTAEIAIRPLQEAIGDVPWIGFHTYGESAPIAGEPFYHNSTVVLSHCTRPA